MEPADILEQRELVDRLKGDPLVQLILDGDAMTKKTERLNKAKVCRLLKIKTTELDQRLEDLRDKLTAWGYCG